jgi:hypothetical protein
VTSLPTRDQIIDGLIANVLRSSHDKKKTEKQRRAFHAVRIGTLIKIFGYRYGGGEFYVFTDDDAGREDLIILLDHYARGNPLAVPRVIKARAPWLSDTEREELLEQVARFPRTWTSAALAEALNLTEQERIALGGIRTIGAVDVTPEQRKQQRKQKDCARKRKARRAAGKQTRPEWLAANSKSREKPWEAEGISRRTYYRRLKKQRGTGPSAIKLVNSCGTTCATERAAVPKWPLAETPSQPESSRKAEMNRWQEDISPAESQPAPLSQRRGRGQTPRASESCDAGPVPDRIAA